MDSNSKINTLKIAKKYFRLIPVKKESVKVVPISSNAEFPFAKDEKKSQTLEKSRPLKIEQSTYDLINSTVVDTKESLTLEKTNSLKILQPNYETKEVQTCLSTKAVDCGIVTYAKSINDFALNCFHCDETYPIWEWLEFTAHIRKNHAFIEHSYKYNDAFGTDNLQNMQIEKPKINEEIEIIEIKDEDTDEDDENFVKEEEFPYETTRSFTQDKTTKMFESDKTSTVFKSEYTAKTLKSAESRATFKPKNSKPEHKELIFKSNETALICRTSQPFKTISTLNELPTHLNAKRLRFAPGTKFKCKICRKIFASRTEINTHIHSKHKCSVCGELMLNDDDLSQHMKEKHCVPKNTICALKPIEINNRVHVNCKDCGMLFPYVSSLISHKIECHSYKLRDRDIQIMAEEITRSAE